jgi:hypothetical protein
LAYCDMAPPNLVHAPSRKSSNDFRGSKKTPVNHQQCLSSALA